MTPHPQPLEIMSMTLDEAKQRIANKITSLSWKITSIREQSSGCIHLAIESDAAIPHLHGAILLWPDRGLVDIYVGSIGVLCSSEQPHVDYFRSLLDVDYFRSLLEKHRAQEAADKNRIIIETATALQNL